jgi:Tol biopolymer transport system component/predicted Ser/Thr protein kinase
MSFNPGDCLGAYEIAALIGNGGMGEVYRATDTRLGRPVAIKVSRREFNDRFEREARAISALNHPNICTLYDVGPNYLVMEFVEGELLSKLIGKGPLLLDKALAYAVQIVDALAAAHGKGVIHRDLKPGNIIITRNGVKVLDFGLAKLASERLSDNSDQIETMTDPITHAGAIVGTLYYVSPEQVEAKNTDERSDIFSFGVVLYEMITGQRPFTGDSQAAVLASLMKDQPSPISQRQPAVPRSLERLVRKCLEKKPEDRWQSTRDLKPALELIDLDAPAMSVASASGSAPVALHEPVRKKWLWPSLALAAILAMASLAYTLRQKPAAPVRASRFEVQLPQGVDFAIYVSVSPDGHKLVFTATGAQSGIWIRDLDTLEWRHLPGTEGALSPFWSPDSRSLGFALGLELKKIDLAGGSAQTLCSSPNPVGTGTWGSDGVIVFGSRGGGPIRRVSASGGAAIDVTAVAATRGEDFHALPSLLPDGKHFLYLRQGGSEVAGIYAASIDAKPEQQPKDRILATKFGAPYVEGNLFFMRDDTLMVQPFDAGRLQLSGEPMPVAEHVGTFGSSGYFSVSPAGVLAYRSGESTQGSFQPTWFDRQGKELSKVGDPIPDVGIQLSPDASQAAARTGSFYGPGDIWLLDLTRGVRTRLTFLQSLETYPVWSPDATRIAFSGGAVYDTIFEKTISGTTAEVELLKEPGVTKEPTSWSTDDRFLLYHTKGRPKTKADLWVLPLDGDHKPVLLLGTDFNEVSGAFSPDRRWVAYVSDESGRPEIYVRPFVSLGPGAPALGEGKWQVSRDGIQITPFTTQVIKWRNDGKEIVFYSGSGSSNTEIMAVDVNGSGPAFQTGTPHRLLTLPANGGLDMTADGKRFLVSTVPGIAQQAQAPLTVVLNWQADLKR